MSLVHSRYFETTPAEHPSRRFDMLQQTQAALASHGPTKRKPMADSIPVEQENEVQLPPTKRVCTPPIVLQGQCVLSPSGTPSENGATQMFVDVRHWKRASQPGRTRSHSNAENVPWVHTGSIGASSSLPVAVPDEADTNGSSQNHGSSPEKPKIDKGKQPDRRHKHKHKHTHEARQDPAQQFLLFMQKLQIQVALHNEAHAAAQRPTPTPVPTGEPQAEPEPCALSRFGPVAQYPGVMYQSPFEGMLVKRSPWPAAAAVLQEVGCECSICVRALAKRLKDGSAPPFAAAMHSGPSESPDQPPALEPAWIGGGPHIDKSNSSNLPVQSVPTAPSPDHQFFPHIKEALSGELSNVSQSQTEAGPSRPSTMRSPPPSGQDLFSMFFAASMAGLWSTVG